jgi:hypothetical protein
MLSHLETAISRGTPIAGCQWRGGFSCRRRHGRPQHEGGAIAHAYGLDECSLFPPAPSRAEFDRYILAQSRQEPGSQGTTPQPLKPKRP